MNEVQVSLAPLDSTDMAWCRENRNNHAIWKNCRQFDVISDREQFEWFERQHNDPTIRMYKIVVDAPQQKDEKGEVTTPARVVPAGVCGLTSIDHVNRRAEFSLWITPALQGKGLGRLALRLLLGHAFSNIGLNLVWGESFAGNQALKMFESLGFKLDGTRRQFYFRDGKFIDAHLFSITAEEFYARASDSQHAATPGASLLGLSDVGRKGAIHNAESPRDAGAKEADGSQ